MPYDSCGGNLVAKITIKAERNFLPMVTGFVRSIAIEKGLPKEHADGLENVTEEACLNVIDHAFAAGTDAYFSVSVERHPGQLVVAIEDRGLPLDWKKIEKGQGMGLGMLLIKAFTDEVRFQNLEGSGKRLELVKNLSAAPMSPALSEEIFSSLATAARPAESAVPVVNPAAPRPAAPVAPAVPVSSSASEIRMMRADEGVKLARLFYKNRDYNYEDDVFFPEKIQELIEGGLQKSAVAVLPNGEFAAHLAIIKRKADSFVGETGRGAVDPAHRGDGLFEMLKRRLIEQAREDEMYGLYSESSIMDQYIQRTNMALGAKETGISLGGVLENGDTAGQASLLMYLRTGEEPNRIVYPPFHHRTMIGRIYEYGGFHRHLDNMSLSAHPPVKPGDVSRLESKMIPETGVGYITVLHYGSDLQDAVNAQLQDLMRQRINNVYLDLPLANAATPGLCGAVEVLGFFFSGIIPETSSGDVLRLQYLTRPDAGIANARPVTDFSRDLLDYVISMSPV